MERWLETEIASTVASLDRQHWTEGENPETAAKFKVLNEVLTELRRRTVAVGTVGLEDWGWVFWLESDEKLSEVKDRRIRIIKEE